MMDREEFVIMYFEEIVKKKKDFSLINHLTMWHLSQKFPKEEIWEAILYFNNDEEWYLKDKISADKSNTN